MFLNKSFTVTLTVDFDYFVITGQSPVSAKALFCFSLWISSSLRAGEAMELWETSLGGTQATGKDELGVYADFLERQRWQLTTRRPLPLATLGKGM